MRSLCFFVLGFFSVTHLVLALTVPHVDQGSSLEGGQQEVRVIEVRSTSNCDGEDDTGKIIPQNDNTTRYAVDGSAIPDVDFDIGESYAGLMPISSNPNATELYFWFFPSNNTLAGDEILIWLNGGPGCSSLSGLLQENGPFQWQPGTFKPVVNDYSWTKLTNVIWVEQPAGTGFSKVGAEGAPQNEHDVARDFLGFWRNFVDTFGLQGRKVYLAGESYAGYYIPYITDAMYKQDDKTYYNVDSFLMYDPSTTYGVVLNDAPSVPFVDSLSGLFSLNDSFMDDIHTRWEDCGYKDFLETALTFPPAGPLPPPPNRQKPGCSVYNDIKSAATLVNPCFNSYHVATTCPLLWDVLGFPGSIRYLPEGAQIYFDRPEVKKAINAPQTSWSVCKSVLSNDNVPSTGLSILPGLIEKNQRTIIGQGDLDFVILTNGTLAMIQNMTWNGQQGFSTPPNEWDDFFVPYHPYGKNKGDLAGAGNMGAWNTERGLTFVTVGLSGHMLPQFAPSAAYRHVEYLLGRITDLGAHSETISAVQQ